MSRWHYIDVVLGDKRCASFRYYLPKSKDQAVAKALAYCLNVLLGRDVDPWPYIKERDESSQTQAPPSAS